MPKQKKEILRGYYHCIRCDSIFAADIENKSSQKCAQCHGLSSVKLDVDSDGYVENHKLSREGEVKRHQKTKPARSGSIKKKLVFVYKVFAVIAVLLVVLAGLKMMLKMQADTQKVYVSGAYEIANKEMKLASNSFLQIAIPELEQVLQQFEFSKSTEAKLPYIHDRSKVSYEFRQYYKKNFTMLFSENEWSIDDAFLLSKVRPMVIGAIISDELGNRSELQFVKEYDTWRIDWESYVCFNRISWDEINELPDKSEEVFRFYMRVMKMDETASDEETTLLFYPAVKNSDEGFSGYVPISIRIPNDGLVAQQVEDALKVNEDDDDFEYRQMISEIDPEGYHRVRVKLRVRKGDLIKPSFELVDIIADDWYGFKYDGKRAQPLER
ncbi:MAG: hypothetical protein ACSHX0_12795 [Akkermansiaceae bacterium]